MLAIWGVATVTVKLGLAALGALPLSAAQATGPTPMHNPNPMVTAAHTPNHTPLFFMTLLLAARRFDVQRV
jgi:hypothetical protein